MAWLLGTELPSPERSHYPKFAPVSSLRWQTLSDGDEFSPEWYRDRSPPRPWPAYDHSLFLPKGKEREKSVVFWILSSPS